MNWLVVFGAQYLVFVLAAAAAAVWWSLPPRKRWDLLVTMVLAGIIGLILIKVSGVLFYDPRPFVSHHVTPLFAHVADNGFPSDHTTFAAVIGFSVLVYSRLFGSVFLATALVIGASRVAANVHSPIDIIGGFALGGLAVLAAYLVQPFLLRLFTKA